MKRHITELLQGALICAACSFASSASAELLLSDNFDYPTGALYNQGDWVKLTTNTDAPIQVVSGNLTRDGYQASPVGNAVALAGNDTTKPQRLQKAFADDGVTSGTLFYALLVKPTDFPQSNSSKYIVAGFTGKNFNGWGDGVGNTAPYAALSVTKGSADGKFKFGVAPSTAVPTLTDSEYSLGLNYLVVVKYDFATKDIALWVNPADASATPTVTLAGKGSISTTNGVQAVCLYQQGSSLAQGAFMVDALKVSTDLADIFDGTTGGGQSGNEPSELPSATLSTASVEFPAMFQGRSATQTVNLTAENLTAPLSIVSTSAAFTVSPSSISAAEAMAGTSFTITFQPASAGSYAGTIEVVAANESLASLSVSGTTVPVVSMMNYAYVSNGLYEKTLAEGAYYYVESRYSSVTYVDNPGKRFFIQDMVGAFAVDCSMLSGEIPVKVGDKFKKFYLYHSDGTLYLMDGFYEDADITEGTPKEPTPYSLADIQFDPESYWNKLVTIENLEFVNAGDQFAAASTAATDPDGNTVNVRPFGGSDIIGATIPAKASVTGLLLGKDGNAIWPRTVDDIEGVEAQTALEIFQKLDFSGVAAPINADTRFATFTVRATDLEKPVGLWLGGANRAMFSLSTEQIPAGTGTYEVVVTYHPTSIGTHKAAINFDATPTELSASYSFTAKAYDPDNLPSITVPDSVEPMSSTPGQTVQQTIAISSANMFEYGQVVVESQSTPGTFTINSSSFYYNMPVNVVVSFRPLAAGSYTATLKFSAPMAQDCYVQIVGECTGSTPVTPTEGGELNLDTSAPLTLLIENFDNVLHNQPLAIDGWSNVAVEGTRAWWGYTFSNETPVNKAAKVTAYDSKSDDDEPCEMLLVTPALDYKNAASRIFTCRIMGDFLPSDGNGNPLEVLYIEDEDYMEVLGGMGIPTSADYNKEWIDYVIDLDGLDLADTFFIGFRLTSQRGRNNTSVYYVDNVSWGREDVPQIKVSHAGYEMEGVVGQSNISDEITVTGLNLSEDISLKVSGANASKFETSVEKLGAEGGTFRIIFTPEELGVHEAFVELSSKGAPTVLLPVAALAKESSGVDNVIVNPSDDAQFFNLRGIRVDNPANGFYIVRRGGSTSKVFLK